jgi:DNA-binding MarR family transcriptional regulator
MGADSEPDYAALLAFRVALRRFNRWTEDEARAAGVTPAQHQLLLCVRGFAGERGPTVGDIAELLLLRHHSTVELIDRAETAGLLARRPDEDDGRTLRIGLTSKGSRILRRLSTSHEGEVRRLVGLLQPVLDAPARPAGNRGGSGHRPTERGLATER